MTYPPPIIHATRPTICLVPGAPWGAICGTFYCGERLCGELHAGTGIAALTPATCFTDMKVAAA